MSGAIIIIALILAPVLIGKALRARGRSRASAEAGERSFANLSGWSASDGGNSGGSSGSCDSGGSDGGGGCD